MRNLGGYVIIFLLKLVYRVLSNKIHVNGALDGVVAVDILLLIL